MASAAEESERLEWTWRIADKLRGLRVDDVAAVLMVALPPKWLKELESTIDVGVRRADSEEKP